MSHFKPDLFKELSNKGFALDSPSSPMDLQREEQVIEKNPELVVNAIQEYSKGMTPAEKHLYDYAKLTIATSRNIYDPAHLMNAWFEYFLQTYKKIYPELNTKELEKCMDCVEDNLIELSRKVEPKDQEMIVPVIIGFLEKMI